MATVTFTDQMPSGRRISDLFKPVSGEVTSTPEGLAFQIYDGEGDIDVVYVGVGLTEASGNVTEIRFSRAGQPWATYTGAFSYSDLQSFHGNTDTVALLMAGADSVTGSWKADDLQAYAGNDSLDGGTGADSMEGGAGNDTYFVDNTQDRVIESADGGIDQVYTTVDFALAAEAEVEFLRAAADALALHLTGSRTSNSISGTAGNDTLDGAGGADTLIGGAGDDTYIVNSPSDVLVDDAWAGYDTVLTHTDYTLAANLEVLKAIANSAAVSLTGNGLDNDIIGNTSANILQGLGGSDRLYGDGGDDQLYGGDGNDQLFGGIGNDTLYGGAGDDSLYADVGNDYLRGDDGNDLLYGGPGNDGLYGDNGNDVLYGDVGDDKLYGGAGNDRLYGGLGKNVLSGGDGKDLLYGGMHSETISGDAGNDKLYGDAGNDILNGGLGNDTLSGGKNSDTFIFNTRLNKTTNVDRISDFSVVQDRIKLDDAIFKKIGKRGILKADAFHIGSSAQDAEDRIVYHSGNGTLYYDSDGSGPASQVRFAILKSGLKLKANDFYVI